MSGLQILNTTQLAFFAYIGAGILFSFAFLSKGIERIDAASRGTQLGFRLIILPAVAGLWPVLLYYWVTHGTFDLAQADIRGSRTARFQSPLFILLGLIAAVAFFSALYTRQPPIYSEPPRQIKAN